MLCWNLVVLWGLSACEDPGTAGADAGGEACVRADLIAQCPPGSNPILGAQAEASCTTAVGGVVEDGEGQATGQCYGVGACRVVCRFAVPCRCGVASVSVDGVLCADCEGAASCGNDRCEGGETPENCPIDCGGVCQAGERRCDGELLQACNLQGRFDTLPCPRGEVCEATQGMARCARDPEVIIGGRDAGTTDGGADSGVVDDGRLIPGTGTWPNVADRSTAPIARALTQRVVTVPLDQPPNGVSPLVNHMFEAGARDLYQWHLLPEGRMEGFGVTATVWVGSDGAPQERPLDGLMPADEAYFCRVYEGCRADISHEQCVGFYPSFRAFGAWKLACLLDYTVRTGDCTSLVVGDQVCGNGFIHPYPAGFTVPANLGRWAAGRELGATPNLDRLLMLDQGTGVVSAQTPVPGFTTLFADGTVALSADGRVAAVVAQQGIDQVIVLWYPDSDERRVILPLSGGRWTRIALSPDGQVLALYGYSTGDRTVEGVISLWNVAEERRIVSIKPPAMRGIGLFFLAFSPNGRELAVDVGFEVEIWELGRVPEKRQVLSHNEVALVERGAYSPDGVTLALKLGPMSLWDTSTGQRFRTIDDVPGNPREVRFTEDGQRLLVLLEQAFVAYHFVVLEP